MKTMTESKTPKNFTITPPSPPPPKGPQKLKPAQNSSQGPPRPTLPGDKPEE